MRSLARFVMRGPGPASLAAAVLFLLPVTSWLALAILVLVTLRAGIYWGGLVVLAIVLLQAVPGMIVHLTDLLALIGILFSAIVLRQTVRMDWAIIALVLTIGLTIALLETYFHQLLAPVYEDFRQLMDRFREQASPGYPVWGPELDDLRALESLGFAACAKSLVGLLMGRWWQASLYNPQGFGHEFRNLRINKFAAFLLSGSAFVLTFQQDGVLQALFQLGGVPLLVAGIGLVHWWVRVKEIKTLWLPLFYVSLLLTYPFVVLLAVIDSFVNLRQRIKTDQT